MAFVDELKIRLTAGRGGDGVVRWLNLKGKEYSGPAGGDGGKGGDVYARAVRDIEALERHVNKRSYTAGDGKPGEGYSREGGNGEDFVFEVPVGSVLTNLTTEEEFELLAEDDEAMLLKGGAGGRGNEHFKGSQNRTPEQSTPGKPGETGAFHVELRLVVDAGLIGQPNAGKSSLLNELTGARAKVGSYSFTTLNPNLGMLYGFILADIPGLIEGASEGKGLGHAFLRHITRTKTVIHCVSAEHEDVAQAYRGIRAELDRYSHELAEKPEIVLLTKHDMVTPEEALAKRTSLAEAAGIALDDVLTVSVYDDQSLKALSDTLTKKLG